MAGISFYFPPYSALNVLSATALLPGGIVTGFIGGPPGKMEVSR
jgi:hypothetical protein